MKTGGSYIGSGEVINSHHVSTPRFLQTIFEIKFQEENMCIICKLLKEEAHETEVY
jgi:hypothetical protein